jgi:hypothetical protein
VSPCGPPTDCVLGHANFWKRINWQTLWFRCFSVFTLAKTGQFWCSLWPSLGETVIAYLFGDVKK